MTARPFLGLGMAWRPEVSNLALGRDDLGFVDVIAEHLPARGPLPYGIELLREHGVAVVPHGVELSLGGAAPVDRSRLAFLATVADRVGAPLVSEHVAFVRADGREAGHLLPVPRTRDSLAVIAEHVRHAMGELAVPLALENAASVFEWPDAEMTECEFLSELVERTGCLLLLDLANLYVNGHNHGFDPLAALDRLPLDHVAYVHVAGGHEQDGVLHDTHADALWPDVLTLVEELARRVEIRGLSLERERNVPCRAELGAELDALAWHWDAGRARRQSRPADAGRVRRPGAAESTNRHDRRLLAAAQSELVAALVDGRPDPSGFRQDRLAIAREVLARKRLASPTNEPHDRVRSRSGPRRRGSPLHARAR